MHFFERQDEARGRTRVLVALLVLSVVAIVLSLYGTLWLGFWLNGQGAAPGPKWLGSIAVCVAASVALGSGLKSLQLRGGGGTLATRLGGRLLDPGTTALSERRLLNVVEEMAIASGLPVPAVYVMDRETAINAFAAGWTPDDAALGVSAGALERLQRAELQGVMAHEVSHILSGDMRLNIRLIGVLHGILMLSVAGAYIARFGAGSRRSAGAPMLVGGAIWLVGSIGLLFGTLIKAAVSRQREFLADASAVQLTRDPTGLAGALLKAGSPSVGARLKAVHASEASHLLFAAGASGWTASHPPLQQRVRRLVPGFDGEFPEQVPRVDLHDELQGVARLAESRPLHALPNPGGPPTVSHLTYAQALLAAMPSAICQACREPEGARLVVFTLLLGSEPNARRARVSYLEANLEPALFERFISLRLDEIELDLRARLPLLDLCLPALRQLPSSRRERLLSHVAALAHIDGKVEVLEWSLWRILCHHLRAQKRPLRRAVRQGVAASAHVLLSFVAHAGARNEAEAQAAYAAGARVTGLPFPLVLPRQACALVAVDPAIDRLVDALPKRRDELVRGLAACVEEDHRVGVREAEAFRAVAEALGCPVPPLLAGQRL